jgi:hypothetical protein
MVPVVSQTLASVMRVGLAKTVQLLFVASSMVVGHAVVMANVTNQINANVIRGGLVQSVARQNALWGKFRHPMLGLATVRDNVDIQTCVPVMVHLVMIAVQTSVV